ncbi:MAG TPA: tetratricopeptide repeat protein [Pyrinomonadaceae bacterium]|jgi:TolA-binding protein|nr:tetratricopeptide repeat protein [Pyrinomonadaceae bacterium]
MFSLSGRAITHKRNYHALCALFAALLLIIPFTVARGQGGTDSMGTGGKHTIQGRIFFPSGRAADFRAKVRLEGTNTSGLYVLADSDGGFRFRNVDAGSYTLTVEAGEDYEPATESIYIEGDSSLGGIRPTSSPVRIVQVPIYLQLRRMTKTGAKPGVLNAALASAPKPAAELYNKAVEAIQARDTKKAIELLRGAVSLYPEFALALNELGVQYLRIGQPDRAAEVLQATLKLKPDAIVPRLNYGIALLEKKQFAEAEAQLREVLKRNDSAATAHLYLGITLIQVQNYDEAEKELQRSVGIAGSELSQAHYYLGGIYWRKKEYKRAADELEAYLKLVPKAPDAERTRASIKELRAKQTTSPK